MQASNVLFFAVNYCPDIAGGSILRKSQFEFTITCLEGGGINSTDIYRCNNGVWEFNGSPTSPECTTKDDASPVTVAPGKGYFIVHIVHVTLRSLVKISHSVFMWQYISCEPVRCLSSHHNNQLGIRHG